MVSGEWPFAELDPSIPADLAQGFAVSLQSALEYESVVQVAIRAGLSNRTIYSLLAGETWPDVVSITKLETTLERLLWPRDAVRRLAILNNAYRDPPRAELEELRQLMDASRELELRWERVFAKVRESADRRDPMPPGGLNS